MRKIIFYDFFSFVWFFAAEKMFKVYIVSRNEQQRAENSKLVLGAYCSI